MTDMAHFVWVSTPTWHIFMPPEQYLAHFKPRSGLFTSGQIELRVDYQVNADFITPCLGYLVF
jgi:hypothetical protein